MKLAPHAPRRIYIASSWRNTEQTSLVQALRRAGHEVYDFRNPAPGNTGFHWSSIDPKWKEWTPTVFADAVLTHPTARKGFDFDRSALDAAQVCVLLLPSGRSAHLEAGYAAGQGKRVLVYLSPKEFEPELMYLLADGFVHDTTSLLVALDEGDRDFSRSPLNRGQS